MDGNLEATAMTNVKKVSKKDREKLAVFLKTHKVPRKIKVKK